MKTSKKDTPLRRAVEWLKKEGRINRDNDLATMFQLDKSTISTYLNGVPGIDFRLQFEKKFGISLKDFEKPKDGELAAGEPESSYGNQDQAILLLSESNRRLSEIIIKQTDVHYEEARTNRILAEVNSTIVSKMPNSLIPSRALQDFSSQLSRVIEQMALRGIPDQWKTFEEGREILDRLLSFEHQGKKSKDTDSGVGKGHK
jgi:hypothetical protein